MTNNIQYAFAIITLALFALIAFFMTRLSTKIDSIANVETIRVDTVTVTKTKTFQLPAPKAKTIYKDKIVTQDKIVYVGVVDSFEMMRLKRENDLLRQSVSFADSINTYTGIYTDGDLELNYMHKTTGELLASEYDYKINSKTVTVEKTRTIEPKFAVHAESGFRTIDNKNFDPFVGARVDLKRFSVRYDYSIQSKSHGVGVGYKIFKK